MSFGTFCVLIALLGGSPLLIILMIVGTPSLTRPSTVEAVVQCVDRHMELAERAEITLEANPTSAETDKLRYVHVPTCNTPW